MDFAKYQALGNVYLVIDPNRSDINLTPTIIRRLCDWHYGVGADGILFGPILENDAQQFRSTALQPDRTQCIGVRHFRLRIFNPDGSEAETSGNGLRIFSRYLVDEGYVEAIEFTLLTQGGAGAVAHVRILDQAASSIQLEMGIATFQSDLIPMTGPVRTVLNEGLVAGEREWVINCLSLGNPHCVIFLPEISAALAQQAGPQIENHPAFPNRTNVQFVSVIDRHTLQIEIWERGTGYTLASGSSSCAAACVALRLGRVESPIVVRMPGGELNVTIEQDGRILLTGPVKSILTGYFSPTFWQELTSSC